LKSLSRRFTTFALLLTAFTTVATAQQPARDTTPTGRLRRPLFNWKEAVGFAAVAGLSYASDQSIRNTLHDRTSTFGNDIADLGNGFGDGLIVFPTLALGVAAGKIFHSKGLVRVSWRALQSTGIAGASAAILKVAIGRSRPFQTPNDHNSFHPFRARDDALPSGHAAVAFALATSFSAETKDHLSDVGFYTLATVTGYARMHYDKHWASDIVVGAGLGILAARWAHRRSRLAISTGPHGVGASFAF
jgi:membrane-associated phospholipid phosphatase